MIKLISSLAKLIKESEKTLVLTGAGISTESGIPDYRSAGTGLWNNHPMQKATVTYLMTDPEGFFEFNIPRWTAYNDSKPNIAHIALAKMEQHGLIHGVITQNIDSLHLRAGSKRLWEVHGHLRTAHCLQCRKRYDFDELTRQFSEGINPPRCRCNGMLRPDVVLFEDPLDNSFNDALQHMEDCDLFIVVGSSLQVYPVAGLPQYCERLAIINRDPTPLDNQAEIVIRESAGEVFQKLLEYLNID